MDIDRTSFLDADENPQVCLLTSLPDFDHKTLVQDFEFVNDDRIKCPDLLSFLSELTKFEVPSALQSLAWSSILYHPRKSLMVQVRNTRQDKILTYVLPMVVLVDPAIKETQVICVVPNNKVAGDVLNLVRQLVKNASITYRIRTLSNISYDTLPNPLRKESSQIVIATAEVVKLLFIKNDWVKPPLKIVVFSDLDETLRIVEGFGFSRHAMEYVDHDVQLMLVSSSINDSVNEFSRTIKMERRFDRLFNNPEELALQCASHYKIVLSQTSKANFISTVCRGTYHQIIVFVTEGEEESFHNSLKRVRFQGVVEILDYRNDPTGSFSRFKSGRAKVLITSLRKLDWRYQKGEVKVCLVVHATLPRVYVNVFRPGFPEPVLHPDYQEFYYRSSLAGKLGRSGVVLSLIEGQKDKEIISAFESYFERFIPVLPEDTNIDEIYRKHGVESGHKDTKYGEDIESVN